MTRSSEMRSMFVSRIFFTKEEKRASVSVVWESPPFPDYQWTIRGDVDKTYGAGLVGDSVRSEAALALVSASSGSRRK